MQGVVLALVRVERNAPRPDAAALRAALEADRMRLGLARDLAGDVAVAGPYRVRIDGRELDEYVVWEH